MAQRRYRDKWTGICRRRDKDYCYTAPGQQCVIMVKHATTTNKLTKNIYKSKHRIEEKLAADLCPCRNTEAVWQNDPPRRHSGLLSRVGTSPQLTSPHLTSTHLKSSQLTFPHLIKF